MGVRLGYKQTDIGVIPDDWDCERVRDAAANGANAIVGGPFGSDLISSDYADAGVPVIRGQNLSASVVSGDFVFVSPRKAKSLSANLAYPGDLVFTQRGTLGQVSIVPGDRFECYLVSQSQMKVSLNCTRHEPRFVHQYFASSAGQRQITISAIQTGVPHTNLGILRAYHFPAPPLPEQRAIATALSDVDALLSGLDRLIAKKRDLKQAAMQQLLAGQTRLPGFQGEWEQVRLGSLFSFKNGLNKSIEFFGYGTPIVNYMDVFGSAVIHSSSLKGRVSLTKPELKNFEVRKGDVFFTRTSETTEEVGVASVVVDEPTETVFSGFVLRARPLDNRLTDRFKAYCFATPSVRKQITSKASYTTRALTNGRTLSEVQLPLPPLPEQTAIAAALSDMAAELAALEARRDKTRGLKQAMMQELLTGKTRLVPHDATRTEVKA